MQKTVVFEVTYDEDSSESCSEYKVIRALFFRYGLSLPHIDVTGYAK